MNEEALEKAEEAARTALWDSAHKHEYTEREKKVCRARKLLTEARR